MTARRNERGLIARVDDPDPTVRSLFEFLSNDGNVSWAPHGERGRSVARLSFRGLNLGTSAEGGFLAASRQPRAEDVLNYLGAKLVARLLGVNYVDAAAADFSAAPKVTGGASLACVGEGDAPAEAAFTLAAILPALRTGIAWVDVTHLLWKLTGGVTEEVVTRELFDAAARGLDRLFFHGGGGAENLGLASVPGVATVDCATVTLAKLAELLGDVEAANADPAAVAWALAPDVAKVLRQRPKATGGERMLFEDGKILDRPAYVSNSVDPGYLFVGDFAKASILVRDVELLVDRASRSTTGAKRLVAYVHFDTVVHQAACFAVGTGVS